MRRAARCQSVSPPATVFLEYSLNVPVDLRAGRRTGHLTAQYITAKCVTDRQRIATLPITGPKPALEIDAPYLVGR